MIHLIQPPRSRRQVTGGYRYNAAVGRCLVATGGGRLEEVAPEALSTWWPRFRDGSTGECAVFDSLYLSTFGPPDSLELQGAAVQTRLLLHYLPSRSPQLSPERRRELEAVENAWFQAVDGVIATSGRLAKRISRASPKSVQVARPGMDAFFRPSPRSTEAAGAASRLTVVAVGNLVPDKGQLEVVEALAGRPGESLPVRLQLIGDVEVDAAYSDAIRQAAGGIELELCGSLPPRRVAERLQSADLFVSASAYESYGMATAEAVATGVPVLGYRVGEVDEWVRDGENGCLVAAGDRAGFRDRLVELLGSATRLRSLRDNAIAPRFQTWQDTCRQFRAACRGQDPVKEPEPELYARCDLPTDFGTFGVRVYETELDGESILIQMGDLAGDPPPLVRVHSECFTGEVLHSLKCDCRSQLEGALRTIAEHGRGAVVYLRQEGRGIGLGNKIRAYAEQQKGADTLEANEILGFPPDLRDFSTAAKILKLNGADRVVLNTNNPDKIASLEANGVAVDHVQPSTSLPNPHNLGYLQTKFQLLGHAGLAGMLRGETPPDSGGDSKTAHPG